MIVSKHSLYLLVASVDHLLMVALRSKVKCDKYGKQLEIL